MGDGIESIGEAVTGGAAARAVEPLAGEAGRRGHNRCLNCETPLEGEFCHACGQAAHVHRTLTAWWHDLVHGVLHLDGKIWRTLPLLFWRPGQLTRRYIDGERARFVSPMALFLFSVFLMFAIFSAIGGPIDFNGADEVPAQERAEARQAFEDERAGDQARLEELRRERQRIADAGQPTGDIDTRIGNLEREIQLEARLQAQTMRLIGEEEAREAEAADAQEPARAGEPAEADEPAKAQVPAKAEEPAEDNLIFVEGADSFNQWFNAAYRRAKENPKLLAYKIQANAYKFSWALIPLSVPFVWLLFLHRRRYRREYRMYDHTVFVTYSIAFMSLGAIALTLLRPILLPGWVVAIAITFVPPIHIYKQLRGTYSLSRFSAAWRTFALLFFAFVATSLFFTMLLMLGVLG